MVGTTLCVGVIGMYHSGIGGGGFMLVRSASGEYESIDFRESAPAAAHQDMYQGNYNGSIFGGLAVGVPGELRGLEYLHQKYGVLPWKVVVTPAVQVARNGFEVSADLVRYMAAGSAAALDNKFLVDDSSWAVDFAPNGTLLGRGDTFYRKRYADTLETISDYGAKAFYEGPIANAMIRAINETNGTMTTEDLKTYKAVSRPSSNITYRGYKLHSVPAPSSGSVALSVFQTIAGYNMSDPSNLPLSTHRLDEAIRFAYGARTQLGDPEYVDNLNVLGFQDEMLSENRAEWVRSRISDDTTRNVSWYHPKVYEVKDNHGTSHIATADASGMSVSSTTTINLLFGSGIMEPVTGIILNNEMADFSLPETTSNPFGYAPNPANFIRPLKRPLSSITPIIVEHANNTLYISTGAAGGSRIITATVQAVWHMLDHGLNVSEALKQQRLHDQLIPDRVGFEEGYDEAVVKNMIAKGHKTYTLSGSGSSVQGIRVLDFAEGVFEAAGEPRQVDSAGLVF